MISDATAKFKPLNARHKTLHFYRTIRSPQITATARYKLTSPNKAAKIASWRILQ
jgi:hypothetical protein